MTAYAVVVTHQSATEIDAALDALQAAGTEVLVVDNASTDGTADRVSRRPGVRLLRNPANLGFAAAVNQGWRALPPVAALLLVNPDCVVGPDLAAALLGHLDRHPAVGIVAPRIVDAAGRPVVSAHPFESVGSVFAGRFGGALLPAALRRRLGGRDRRRAAAACLAGSTEPVITDWVSGACLAVRTELLHRTGGLDEDFFLYYEDEELCRQAGRLGYRVELLPQLVVRHRGGASSTAGSTWPQLYRSMIIFFGRHRPRQLPALRAVITARALLGWALASGRVITRRPGGRDRRLAWSRVLHVALTFRPASADPTRDLVEVPACGW